MHILIAEDEQLTAERLRRMLTLLLDSTTKYTIVDTVAETIGVLENGEKVDLLLLDIHLADGSSLDLFNLTEVRTPVIFTTAYDEHAVQAFRLNAIDYLLKPVRKEELSTAIERFRGSQLANQNLEVLTRLADQDKVPRRYLIRIANQLHLIEAGEVAFFYTEDRITFLHTFADRRYPLDQSLENVEAEVDENTFFRINRQVIINRRAISEMHAYSKARVKLVLKPAVSFETIVSTERSPHFKDWLIN